MLYEQLKSCTDTKGNMSTKKEDAVHSTGNVTLANDVKLEWMYKNKNELINREEYLLGRAVDKTFEQLQQEELRKEREQMMGVKQPINHVEHDCVPFSIRDYKNLQTLEQVDLQRKVLEDPLVLIKQRELESRRKILENPVKLKELHRILQKDNIINKNDKRKKSKKVKKSKKHKKRRSSRGDSEVPDESTLDHILMKKLMEGVEDGKISNLIVNNQSDDLKIDLLTKELNKVIRQGSKKLKKKNKNGKQKTKSRKHRSSSTSDSSSSESKQNLAETKEKSQKSKSSYSVLPPKKQNKDYCNQLTENYGRFLDSKNEKSAIEYSSLDKISKNAMDGKKFTDKRNDRYHKNAKLDSRYSSSSRSRSNSRTIHKKKYDCNKSKRTENDKRIKCDNGPGCSSQLSDFNRSSYKRQNHSRSRSQSLSKKKYQRYDDSRTYSTENRRHKSRNRSRSPNRQKHSNPRYPDSKTYEKICEKEKNELRCSRSSHEEIRNRNPKFENYSNKKYRSRSRSNSISKKSWKERESKLSQDNWKEDKRAAKLKEMTKNAEWREKERSSKVQRHRDSYAKEEEQLNQNRDCDSYFFKEIKKALNNYTSIKSRLEANMNNIQRDERAMNSSFARK